MATGNHEQMLVETHCWIILTLALSMTCINGWNIPMQGQSSDTRPWYYNIEPPQNNGETFRNQGIWSTWRLSPRLSQKRLPPFLVHTLDSQGIAKSKNLRRPSGGWISTSRWKQWAAKSNRAPVRWSEKRRNLFEKRRGRQMRNFQRLIGAGQEGRD